MINDPAAEVLEIGPAAQLATLYAVHAMLEAYTAEQVKQQVSATIDMLQSELSEAGLARVETIMKTMENM